MIVAAGIPLTMGALLLLCSDVDWLECSWAVGAGLGWAIVLALAFSVLRAPQDIRDGHRELPGDLLAEHDS